MSINFKQIYATQAAQYDAMVSCEDYQGNLWTALRQIRDFAGLDVVDVGAGTGTDKPTPPHAGLAAFYTWLENDLGFHHTTISTNYQFNSVAEAIDLTQFFFGDALANKIKQQQLTILPEFTGIWWRDKIR